MTFFNYEFNGRQDNTQEISFCSSRLTNDPVFNVLNDVQIVKVVLL